MSHTPITPELRRQVAAQSRYRCRYCLSQEDVTGMTATGQATIQLLRLNRPVLLRARERWIKAGWHPPEDQ